MQKEESKFDTSDNLKLVEVSRALSEGGASEDKENSAAEEEDD